MIKVNSMKMQGRFLNTFFVRENRTHHVPTTKKGSDCPFPFDSAAKGIICGLIAALFFWTIGIFLILWSENADAQTMSFPYRTIVRFAWDPVTENEGGTPVVVAGYRLYESHDGSAWFVRMGIAGRLTTATYQPWSFGNYCYRLTAVSWEGRGFKPIESGPSGEVCLIIDPPIVPKPVPTGTLD